MSIPVNAYLTHTYLPMMFDVHYIPNNHAVETYFKNDVKQFLIDVVTFKMVSFKL